MALFSDRCQALIDPDTRRALSGEALEAAKRDPHAPRCGNRVRKAARFCNVCGTPAPGGWWRCPQCRKWVGNDSNFCPHCDAPLFPEDRADIAGGVWSKKPGMFAQRFEIKDIARLLKNDLQIQAGTVALMLDGGRYKGMLEAGRHDPDTLARKINHFGDPPPRSVVLVDAGDVSLPVHVEDLKTSENFPLEFYGEIVLRFRRDDKAALAFMENRMKEARFLSFSDLSTPLAGELRHALEALCTRSTVDDLVRDPERRLRLQDEMENTLRMTLQRSGIELIHVSSAEFAGEQYEALAEKLSELETKRRELEYDQRMSDMLSKDRMTTFKNEHELLEYQELLAHEYGISQERRERERELLHRGWTQADELDALSHAVQVQRGKTAAEIENRTQWEAYEEEKRVKDAEVARRVREIEDAQAVNAAETSARVRNIEFGQEAAETEKALEWRREKEKQKAEAKQREAERRADMAIEQLLADVEDPDQRRDLMELFKMKLQSGQSPEQLLAQAAASSPAAAEALARMKEKSEAQYEEMKSEMRELYRDTAERQDRNLKVMLEPAKAAAERKDEKQTIIR